VIEVDAQLWCYAWKISSTKTNEYYSTKLRIIVNYIINEYPIMLLQVVYCCIALVVPSIDPLIVSIKKFLFCNARDVIYRKVPGVSAAASFCDMTS
jgi:hypothetical protein